MAVKIKLKRMGKIRAPHYRIIVADSRTRRDGRAIEEIGQYNPKVEPSLIKLDSERAQYWLGVGAQPTEPVMAILKVTGDWQKFKGLPGAEGTLKVAEPKADKRAVFDAALAEVHGEPRSEASTPKKKAAKKSAKPKADDAKAEVKVDDAEAKAKGKADDAKPEKAEKPKADDEKAEKTEAKADDTKADKAAAKAEDTKAKGKADDEKAEKTEAKADDAKPEKAEKPKADDAKAEKAAAKADDAKAEAKADDAKADDAKADSAAAEPKAE